MWSVRAFIVPCACAYSARCAAVRTSSTLGTCIRSQRGQMRRAEGCRGQREGPVRVSLGAVKGKDEKDRGVQRAERRVGQSEGVSLGAVKG